MLRVRVRRADAQVGLLRGSFFFNGLEVGCGEGVRYCVVVWAREGRRGRVGLRRSSLTLLREKEEKRVEELWAR